jgi:4-hydroxy-tetrahydrodipicolinate synthase
MPTRQRATPLQAPFQKGTTMTIDAASLHGIIPPVSTPLTPDRALDRESFRRLIEHQLDAGIHGLFVLGSTSEAPLLTPAMQDEVIATAVEVVNGRVPVLAGCIEFSTERVVERGARARDLGADGIVACPPFYVTPSTHEIVRHFEHIHRRVGLPILAYDIPSATHVKLHRPVLKQLAEAGTIVALKDSSGQDANFRGVILDNRDNQQFRIFTGSELTADNALYVGAHGLVPGLGNVDAAGYVRLYDTCVAGDWAAAKAEQERLFRLFDIVSVPPLTEYGVSAAAHGAFKVAIWLQGLIDHPDTAHPHTQLNRDHHRQIAAILQQCGLTVTREP